MSYPLSKRAHASWLRFYFYAAVWVCPEENDCVTAFKPRSKGSLHRINWIWQDLHLFCLKCLYQEFLLTCSAWVIKYCTQRWEHWMLKAAHLQIHSVQILASYICCIVFLPGSNLDVKTCWCLFKSCSVLHFMSQNWGQSLAWLWQIWTQSGARNALTSHLSQASQAVSVEKILSIWWENCTFVNKSEKLMYLHFVVISVFFWVKTPSKKIWNFTFWSIRKYFSTRFL